MLLKALSPSTLRRDPKTAQSIIKPIYGNSNLRKFCIMPLKTKLMNRLPMILSALSLMATMALCSAMDRPVPVRLTPWQVVPLSLSIEACSHVLLTRCTRRPLKSLIKQSPSVSVTAKSTMSVSVTYSPTLRLLRSLCKMIRICKLQTILAVVSL